MEKKIYYEAIPTTNGDFYIKKRELKGRWRNCFLTEEEAVRHFTNAQMIALKKHEKITEGLRKLKEELGDFSFDCEIKVLDDSGLDITMTLEFDIEGYNFRFEQ